ncbi:MAG TPA: hypothetical protein VK843_05895 [Planctomycetota bacterium]|nr:hypothetical protein [Planctomycetota bacterium]
MRAALLLLLAIPLGACKKDEPAKPARAIDERVELFFDPSMARGGYDVDLADPTQIQIQTLLTGEHEPLHQTISDLATDGERGVAAVARLVERLRNDPGGSDYLRNAAAVLSLSPEPAATRLLWTLLEHPSESLQIQALRGLRVHPRPESFDPVLAFLARASDGYQAEVCAELGKLDLPRAQKLWMSWLENGDNKHLWPTILPFFTRTLDPDIARRAAALLERKDLDAYARIWLCAAASGAGDAQRNEPALAELRESRESKNPTERDLAVRALAGSEQFDELVWTLEHEEEASIRMLVVSAAALDERPSAKRLLELAMNDSDPQVRVAALTALANQGAGAAVDEALQWIQSPAIGEVHAGLQILRQRMADDPALATRVWSEFRPRLESIEKRPAAERASLVKLIGLIPLREATKALIKLALTQKDELESMRAQRFILRQAVNAGVPAQDELFELWRASSDELVRMDALEAFSALGGDHSRELLLQVLEDPRTTGQEMVFVADRLVRIGPAKEVAWQIKRATLRMQEPHSREAVQGILWRWYPAPKK